jgi:hypothetical protein
MRPCTRTRIPSGRSLPAGLVLASALALLASAQARAAEPPAAAAPAAASAAAPDKASAPPPSPAPGSARRVAETKARLQKLLREMEALGIEIADVRDGHIVLIARRDRPICMPPGPRPSLGRQPVDTQVLLHAVEALEVADKHLIDGSPIEIDEASAMGACWARPVPIGPAASAPAPAPACAQHGRDLGGASPLVS